HSSLSYLSAALSVLHSFPTRRSSDLRCHASYRARDAMRRRGRALCRLDGSSSRKPAYRTIPQNVALVERDQFHSGLVGTRPRRRSEEHTSELQSQSNLVCRLLLEKKK